MWVGEEEEAGAGIHLKGQRDVGKFVLCTAECVQPKDEITMLISTIMVRVGQGATNIKTTTDEPVEAVSAG